ncbi:MAG TPA: LysR family transcriptional regulator [Pseudolysinimonas sp.]|nr:LysR family transcriptional regulator [Pseudolysinimonas sp.]
MPHFTIVQLEYFCAVAETGSFAKAAARIGVSSAAIAAGVATLERVTGSTLVTTQKARGTKLTLEGHRLYPAARDVLRLAEEAELSLTRAETELVGSLSVGCYPTLAPTVLPGVVEHFAHHHPRVTLSFVIDSQRALVQKLAVNELDCAILLDLYLPETVNRMPLKRSPVYVILGADHRLSRREGLTLEDVKDEPLILYDVDAANTHTLLLFQQAGIHPQVAYRIADYELVKSMVARNLGFSLMVHRPAHALSHEGREVVAVPLVIADAEESIVGIWPEGATLNRRAETFLAVARTVLSAGDSGVLHHVTMAYMDGELMTRIGREYAAAERPVAEKFATH